MNVVAASRVKRDSRLPLILIMVLLAAALAWFASQKLHYLTDYSVDSYTPYYWPRRAGLVLHLSGGVLAILAGLVQIWLGLTQRTGTVHRTLGRIYATGVLMGSSGGFYLALTIPGHPAYRAGLLALNAAWLVTTGMALYSIRTRRIEQHREWMIRSYVVTFAFVTYRLASYWLRLWIPVSNDPVADQVDDLMAWACWAIPLLLAEPLIQLRAMRLRTRTAQFAP
jgi:uncharacterized membrane protein